MYSVPMPIRTARVLVGLLAVATFALSLIIGSAFFENLSMNNDEAVYVLQAEMFAQGDVTLSDSAHGDAFRPWMSGRVGGDRLVLVEQPTLPALMALSEVLFGTMRIAIAAVAGGAVIAVYALIHALLRDSRIAVVGAACFTLSPLVMIQSSMFLSYVLAVGLAAAALALLTRAIDRRTNELPHRAWLIGAGIFEGLLLATRPLEGIILAAILVAWCLLRAPTPRRGGAPLAWVAVWSLPVLLIALVYNVFTTGDPFTFALWTIGGDDSFGFGMRAIAEHSTYIEVGVSEAWLALRVNLRAFPHWVVGGVVSVPVAMWGATRLWSISRPVFWLIVVQLCLTPLAYFFYYGNYLIIGGRNFYGPHYYLALLLPTMLLLAVGIVDLADRPRVVLPCVMGLMALGTLIEVPDKIRSNRDVRDSIAAEVDAIRDNVVEPAVVLIPSSMDGPYVLHPRGAFSNPPDLEAEILFAVDLGSRNAELLERFPDRNFYRFESVATSTDSSGPRAILVEPLSRVSGATVEIVSSAPLIDRVLIDDRAFICSESTNRVRLSISDATTSLSGCGSTPSTVEGHTQEVWVFARAGSRTLTVEVPVGRLPSTRDPDPSPQLVTLIPPMLNLVDEGWVLTPVAPSNVPWFAIDVSVN